MARWLVTGGAGFIGSHLADALVKRGERVRIIDNFSTGHKKHMQSFLRKVELVRGDIRDKRMVRKAVKGIDYVLHQAALRSVTRSLENPIASNEVNAGGTLNILWEALRANVKRVVYASSSSVYGTSKKFPQSPSQTPQPVSPYAVSKLTGEYYCKVFSETFGLSTVSLRYFNVFGPRQDPRSKYAVVIPIFMKAAVEGKPLPVHGKGHQSRDFAHIDNVIHANLLAARKRGVSGEVFNVACGKSYSLLDYVRILESLTGRRLKRKHLPTRMGDVPKTWADISKTRRLLGYTPKVSFSEGVKKTWKAFTER